MKNILQSIGIIFTLITSFLGLLYYLKGDILISGLISSIIVVILFFLIQQFMKNKSEIRKNRFSILSIILWTIYVLLSIPISFFLVHSLNIEINAKNDIKKIADSKMKALDAMNAYYETKVQDYLSTLQIDLKRNLTLYTNAPLSIDGNKAKIALISAPFNISQNTLNNINKINYVSQANNLIKAKSLLFNKVLDTLKIENQNFNAKYGATFENWSRLKLNYAFYQLDNILAGNYKKLKNAYTQNTNLTTGFDFNYPKETGLMNKPVELWQKYLPYYLIFVVLIFNVLLLLPYFLEPITGVYVKQKDGNSGLGGGIEI